MNMENFLEDSLMRVVEKDENELKSLIIDFVGNSKEKKEVTLEDIAIMLSTEFPELLLAMAEQNWLNGYTQAINDVKLFKNSEEEKNEQKNDN